MLKIKHQLKQVHRGWTLQLANLPEGMTTYFRAEKAGKVLTSLNYRNLLALIDQEESK